MGYSGVLSRSARREHNRQNKPVIPDPVINPKRKQNLGYNKARDRILNKNSSYKSNVVGSYGYGDKNFTQDQLPLQPHDVRYSREQRIKVPIKSSQSNNTINLEQPQKRHTLYKFLLLIIFCGGIISLSGKKVDKGFENASHQY